jgi:ankyrin repeat protein
MTDKNIRYSKLIPNENNEIKFIEACTNGNIELVEKYYDLFGKHIFNIYDNYIDSGLIKAIKNGRENIVCFLIDNGMDVNDIYGDYEYTPLIVACQYSQYNIAKYLIWKDVDINVISLNLLTPLKMSAKKMNYKILELLLENYANPLCSGYKKFFMYDNYNENRYINNSIYGTPLTILTNEFNKKLKLYNEKSPEYEQLYFKYNKCRDLLSQYTPSL